ncbi:kinase-like domain-containing protein, partial [Spinellus fusiger]
MPFRAVTEQWRSKWRRQPAEKPSSSLPDTPQTTVQPREIAHYQKPNEPREQRESLPPKEHRETHEPRESKEHKTHTITPPNEVPTPEKKAHEKKISTKEYPPSADTLLGGIGDYIFLDPLGRGKFSTVIMAQHYLTGDKFAVKIIDKRAHDYRVMSRLVREITLMEVIDHPNIVHLYETYETADSLYLVMEYVPGLNLDEYLQRQHGALEEREARAIFRQMVAAVDYCHSRWVVHRDLKAPNILLTPQGDVRLADFGLGNRFGLQRLKTICGSMLYYSPEIISGQKYMGPEVDCWCLGVSLFRMTAGFEPFAHAHTVGELRKDVVHGNYPMPEHLSQGLQRTIRKCLAVDRRKRIALRVALKGDAWLNDNGRLPDLFAEKSVSIEACDGDEAVRLRLEKDRNKRQYMKDMEDERQTGVRAKRTVIYHPLSECIYYTSPTPHSPKPEENHRTQELLRAELFQEIKA